MVDNDRDGFVFENDAASESTHDGTETEGSERPVVGAPLVATAIVVVVLAAIAVPFVGNILVGSLGGGSGDVAPDPAIGTAATTTTLAADHTTMTEPATTRAASAPSPRTALPTAAGGATATPTTPFDRTPTPTATTARMGDGNESDDPATASGANVSDDRSPRIESFAITDRSEDGAATFDVAWTVTDPDSALADVEVRLVADPAGDATTLERRRFGANGRQANGSTAFAVPDGGGAAYEIRIEATDSSGNTAFELAREVADGDRDESVRGPDRSAERNPRDPRGR